MTIENLAPNPSAEGGVTDPWIVANGTLNITDAEHHGAGGSSFLLETGDAGTPYFYMPTDTISCEPGDLIASAAWFRARDIATSGVVRLSWYDDTGSYLLQATGGIVTCETSGWVQATITSTPPSGAAFVTPTIRPIAPTDAAPGVGAYVDEIMMVKGPLPPDWPAYHDGDSPGWQWVGTPNASTSSAIRSPSIRLPAAHRLGTLSTGLELGNLEVV